jgi:hypothetical protein
MGIVLLAEQKDRAVRQQQAKRKGAVQCAPTFYSQFIKQNRF